MLGDKLKDLMRDVTSSLSSKIPFQYSDDYRPPKGEVFMTLKDPESGDALEEHHIPNVITKDFSILLARLCKDSLDPNHGIFALAVGTGDSGWNLQNPPAPTDTQRSLYNEIERKDFSSTVFRDNGGSSSSIPTNTVDFTTVFSQSEAVGPLVEMGLVGGDVSNDLTTTNEITPANGTYNTNTDVTGKDMLCNYLTFPVINKPATAELELTWRITF
jgi:hypothetical protein